MISNRLAQANRLPAFPITAARKFEGAVHARPCVPAANDHLGRSTAAKRTQRISTLTAKRNFHLVAHELPFVRGRAAARPYQVQITFGNRSNYSAKQHS
jgi:hypothetical protein